MISEFTKQPNAFKQACQDNISCLQIMLAICLLWVYKTNRGRNGKATPKGGLFMKPALWGRAEQRSIQSLHPKAINKMPNGQDDFEYTDEILTIFEKFLSPERLAAYYGQARGDKWIAIRLYERNTELSEALYGVLQGLEVTLRNAIHNALTELLGTASWYDKIILEDSERDSVTEARSKIAEKCVSETPGRIIAELTFAFWVRLTTGIYEKSLWVPCLRRIFPVRLQRSVIHGRLVELKTLRNRIAHHERIIFKRDPQEDYRKLLETIGWVSPDVREWVRETNCFPDRFEKRIPKKPKTEPGSGAQTTSAQNEPTG